MPDPRLADLIAFLDGAPSPWHCVAQAAQRLDAAGFVALPQTAAWDAVPARGYTVRGAALVAWHRGVDTVPTSPVHIVGAHTDSPNLRLKPRPDTGGFGWKQLGVEVYGGVLLNSWLDRDLGIAGRLVTVDGVGHDVVVDRPIARVAQLAIHLDRDVNERGLVLDKQLHMTPIWGDGDPLAGELLAWLGDEVGIDHRTIATADLGLFDVTPAALLGADRSLLASGRLDNQVSCWAAIDALTAVQQPVGITAVAALFDHEEVGSSSTSGAAGPVLEHVLERLAVAGGAGRGELLAQLASSLCISADNAHAVHPNYPERHEPGHRPQVNRGPAIKLNSNQRYASASSGVAKVQEVFARADVPSQVFVSRNNMPCGSTIGPLTATRLGVETVDVGVPQLSMHSARELCGVADPPWLAEALRTFYTGAS